MRLESVLFIFILYLYLNITNWYWNFEQHLKTDLILFWNHQSEILHGVWNELFCQNMYKVVTMIYTSLMQAWFLTGILSHGQIKTFATSR